MQNIRIKAQPQNFKLGFKFYLQASFLAYALGGSESYDGNGDMTAAHSRLARDMGMRMEHFDIVLEHLGSALRDLQVPEVGPC